MNERASASPDEPVSASPSSDGVSERVSSPSSVQAAEARDRSSARRDRDRERTEDRAGRDRERAEEKLRKQRESSEREILSWIRMGLTLATTGLGFDRAITYADRLSPSTRIDPLHLLRALALGLLLLGLFAMVAACLRHRRTLVSLRRGELAPEPRFSLGLVVAVGTLTIFILALVVVLAVRDGDPGTASVLQPRPEARTTALRPTGRA